LNYDSVCEKTSGPGLTGMGFVWRDWITLLKLLGL